MPVSNPNGANATTEDPREQKCWDLYVEGLQNNHENAYQAAIDAGYGEAHAKKITIRSWFAERKAKLKRKDMLSKAERNLDRVLDLKTDKEGEENPQLLKIQTDVSTTIVKTLGKDEGYATKGDEALEKMADKVEITDDQFDRIIRARAAKLNSEESGQRRPD